MLQDYFTDAVPAPWGVILAGLAAAAALLGVVASLAGVFIWAERKVAGRMQDRVGPKRVGGPFGILQSLADGVKLLAKEDFIPDAADRWLFRLAPYLAFCASFTAFLALPFGDGVVAAELNVAVFFLLAVLSSEVFGVILAGYASGSKWALFGAMREAAQVVSYEVPRSLCVLVPVVLAGTLNLNRVGSQQAGGFWNWNLFHDPFTFCAFFVFFICATASCKRAPFDLAEAESELVAGYLTEYSGMRWSFFFLAEYASMFAAAALASLLFLGAWHPGVAPAELSGLLGVGGHLINLGAFMLKCCLLIFVMMWMRWSLPRLRIDQVMATCLKYFLPLSCVFLAGVSLWQVLAPAWLTAAFRCASAAVTAGGLLVLLSSLLRRPTSVAPNARPWVGADAR